MSRFPPRHLRISPIGKVHNYIIIKVAKAWPLVLKRIIKPVPLIQFGGLFLGLKENKMSFRMQKTASKLLFSFKSYSKTRTLLYFDGIWPNSPPPRRDPSLCCCYSLHLNWAPLTHPSVVINRSIGSLFILVDQMIRFYWQKNSSSLHLFLTIFAIFSLKTALLSRKWISLSVRCKKPPVEIFSHFRVIWIGAP